jgi:hypothetical protein
MRLIGIELVLIIYYAMHLASNAPDFKLITNLIAVLGPRTPMFFEFYDLFLLVYFYRSLPGDFQSRLN